jgi:hypothetical protein
MRTLIPKSNSAGFACVLGMRIEDLKKEKDLMLEDIQEDIMSPHHLCCAAFMLNSDCRELM